MKMIVVDFDGTLIKENSFPNWIKFALKNSAKTINLNILWSVSLLLLRRKLLKNLDHLEFKRRIDALNYPSGWGKIFVESLINSRSFKVFEQIKTEKSNSNSIIVSTAAPECYAKHIPDVFFNGENIICLHSRKTENKGYFNNFQGNKTVSIKEIADKNSSFVLFSDHSDDYELAKLSETFYLCNPNEKDRLFFNSAGISYTLLRDSVDA